MRRVLAAVLIATLPLGPACADSFRPDDCMISRIAARFRETFKTSGIAGIGQDVLKCYDDSVGEPASMRGCVVYDIAALIFDRSMMQIFTARGMNAVPAPLFTNEVFDARQRTYGRMAF